MHKLLVNKSNNNDDSFVLAEWLVDDGQMVTAQQVVAVVETSKATIDVATEADGLLLRAVAEGARYEFGTAIGHVFADEAERQAFVNKQEHAPAAHAAFTVTKVAREMMAQHGLTDADLGALGKKLIKKTDIEALLSQQSAAQTSTIALSPRQVAIARTVSHSHASIPRAFLAMKVYCDEAQQQLNDLSEREDCMLGLTELLIKAVANLHASFPLCFGTLVDEAQVVPAEAANIGVTMDIGKGLFVPVVADAAPRSLTDIADVLMDYRIKALRDAFKDEDLSGGAISISLNTEPDIMVVLPVILPDQTCMLSLNAVQDEVFLTTDQTIATRSFVVLGLAYDHRVINGYEAVQFVKAIKAQIEAPAQILAVLGAENE